MTKQEFVSKLTSAIDSVCIGMLGDSYDISVEVNTLVDSMAEYHEIEWRQDAKVSRPANPRAEPKAKKPKKARRN